MDRDPKLSPVVGVSFPFRLARWGGPPQNRSWGQTVGVRMARPAQSTASCAPSRERRIPGPRVGRFTGPGPAAAGKLKYSGLGGPPPHRLSGRPRDPSAPIRTAHVHMVTARPSASGQTNLTTRREPHRYAQSLRLHGRRRDLEPAPPRPHRFLRLPQLAGARKPGHPGALFRNRGRGFFRQCRVAGPGGPYARFFFFFFFRLTGGHQRRPKAPHWELCRALAAQESRH